MPTMTARAQSYGNALTLVVNLSSAEQQWDRWLKSSLSFEKLIMAKAKRDFNMMMAVAPKWTPPKSLKQFHDADRTDILSCIEVEYEMHHEVLEIVLNKNITLGPKLSNECTAIVECPDQEELIPLPPPQPKGKTEELCDAVNHMVRKITLQPSLEEPDTHRWEPVDSRVFEVYVYKDGPITCHTVSRNVSVLARCATVDEIRPYHVEFHFSQKAWYDQIRICMMQTFVDATQQSMNIVASPEPVCSDKSIGLSQSMESNISLELPAQKKIPVEIAVLGRPNKIKPKRPEFRSAPSMDGIWIPEFDVVLGVDKSKAATTMATEIMKSRVVPFFASKADLRSSQVQLMALMLQEELKDDERFSSTSLPMANFWMMVSECKKDVSVKEEIETKWLRKPEGDFMGPFVHASAEAIHKAAADWVAEFIQQQSQALAEAPRDPEPSEANTGVLAPLFADAVEEAEEKEEEEKKEQTLQTALLDHSITTTTADCPQLFNLEGPIETLDQKARELCQEWVNASESLLIKAAKKSLIDAFQTDFHSFLFLFQLQLKRIKGGFDNSAKDSNSSVGKCDDKSWVSAVPSVQEEDHRVANIEKACIAFMNQMGNDMVRYYEHLSGTVHSPTALSSTATVKETREESDDTPKGSPLVELLKRQTFSRGGERVESKRLEANPSRKGRSLDPETDVVLKDERRRKDQFSSSCSWSYSSKVRRSVAKPLATNQKKLRIGSRSDTSSFRCMDPELMYQDYRDDYENEQGSTRSHDESLEESNDDALEEYNDDATLESSFSEEPEDDEHSGSYESDASERGGRNRGRRVRQVVDRSDDYRSLVSVSTSEVDDDSVHSCIRETARVESLILSASDLSFEENAKKTSSWNWLS